MRAIGKLKAAELARINLIRREAKKIASRVVKSIMARKARAIKGVKESKKALRRREDILRSDLLDRVVTELGKAWVGNHAHEDKNFSIAEHANPESALAMRLREEAFGEISVPRDWETKTMKAVRNGSKPLGRYAKEDVAAGFIW